MRTKVTRFISLLLAVGLISSILAGASQSASATPLPASQEASRVASKIKEARAKQAHAVNAQMETLSAVATTTAKPAVTSMGTNCQIGATRYATLDDALATITSNTPTTIKLLADVSDTDGLIIKNRTITFDLNGCNLTFSNAAGVGLTLVNSDISYKHAGSFTVSSKKDSGLKITSGSCELTGARSDAIRVYPPRPPIYVLPTATPVYDDPEAPVAAIEAHSKASVIVNGDVSASRDARSGICADSGSSVVVRGDISTSGMPNCIDASDRGTRIDVTGQLWKKDNTNRYTVGALDCRGGAAVSVVGDITSKGDGVYVDCYSWNTVGESTVIVIGNVHAGELAVGAFGGVQVAITGDVSSRNRFGILANEANTQVNVYGKVSAPSDSLAVCCTGGASTKITGQVNGMIEASGSGASVTVKGEVVYTTPKIADVADPSGVCSAVSCYYDASITISGSVTARGNNAEGVYAQEKNALITINGNIKADGTGASAGNGGRVIVNGTITAPTYITLLTVTYPDSPASLSVSSSSAPVPPAPHPPPPTITTVTRTAAQFVTPTTMKGYRTYTDKVSTVWVKGEAVKPPLPPLPPAGDVSTVGVLPITGLILLGFGAALFNGRRKSAVKPR